MVLFWQFGLQTPETASKTLNFGAKLGSAQMSIRNRVEGCLITSIQIEIVSFHEIYIL